VSNDENDSGYAVRYFLFRSMMNWAAFYLPSLFFPQTRKVLRGRGPLKPDVGLSGGSRPLYLSPVRFLPSIITLLKIRLIRVW
jgi:hypothetical protein